VTFDERRGYVASAPELRQPVVALSLGGLRRRMEALMLPDEVDMLLMLDGLARARAPSPPGEDGCYRRSRSKRTLDLDAGRSSTDQSKCHSGACIEQQCLLRPQEQTFATLLSTSEKCHYQTLLG
jgi:hypothetical protein